MRLPLPLRLLTTYLVLTGLLAHVTLLVLLALWAWHKANF